MKEVKNYNTKLCSNRDFCHSSALVAYIRYSHYNQDVSCIEKQKEALTYLMYEYGEVKI